MMFIASYGLQAQVGLTTLGNISLGSTTGTQGNYGTYIGQEAGSNATNPNTTSSYNTFVGFRSGRDIDSGRFNTHVGANAGRANQSGNSNSFFGVNAGLFNISGASNSIFGVNAGYNNDTGNNNSFYGVNSGRENVDGSSNSFYGVNSGYGNADGNSNSFFGVNSGRFSLSGVSNTFIGVNTGYNNKANNNSFFGVNAGFDNINGENNTFLGTASGRFNINGNNNTFVGYAAGYKTLGASNVFIGYGAGYNETGSNKLYIDNSTTAKPLIFGDFATDELTVNGRLSQSFSGNFGAFGNGDKWASLGQSFAPPGVNIPSIYGMINTWGDNTMITGVKSGAHGVVNWSGPSARLDFDFLDNTTNTIQTHMTVTNDGRIGMGTTNPGIFKLYVAGEAFSTVNWTGSDKRYKKEVENIPSALQKVKALDGVTYQFKQKEINNIDFKKASPSKHYGFIAQDLEKVLPELVKKDDAGYYAVNYDGLVPVLVEAIKDLNEKVVDLETKLNNQNKDEFDSGYNNSKYKSIESAIVLKQNIPNPLSDVTKIEYEVPAKISSATLIIFDMNGKEIGNYPVSGKGNIAIDATGLANGTYTYSIIVDGKNLATRKMVVR